MAWVSVPSGWWVSNDNYINDPQGPYTSEQFAEVIGSGYHQLELDSSLTNEQRQPSKIRITYNVAASATGSGGYGDYSALVIDASGMDFIFISSSSATISDSGTIEEDLELYGGFFYSINLSVSARIYGFSAYAECTACEITGVEFYYSTTTSSNIWTSYIGTTEETI